MRIVALLCGVAALAASGCGSRDSGSSSTSQPTASPLSALLGESSVSPDEARRQQLEVENLIAKCMSDQGWEYQPVDAAALAATQGAPDEPAGSEAFGKKYGYGVVLNYEQNEEPALRGGSDTQPQVVDPNQVYVDSLSDAERDAYYVSLYGEQADEGTSATSGDQDSAAAVTGCDPIANGQVYASSGPSVDDPSLAARLEQFEQDERNDPRMRAATEAWLACVSDSVSDVAINGQAPTSVADMSVYVENLKNEALGLESVPWDGVAELDGMYSGSTDASGNGWAFIGDPKLIPEAQLDKLRATELDVWAKDHACQKEARIVEVQTEVEQEFVDDLRAEFPQLDTGS